MAWWNILLSLQTFFYAKFGENGTLPILCDHVTYKNLTTQTDQRGCHFSP